MSRPRYEGLDQPVNPTATPEGRLCRCSRTRRESETGGSQPARSVPLVETFVIRMWLPDRPGALGQVASRIGGVRGDVVGIDILERENGQAVDELVGARERRQVAALARVVDTRLRELHRARSRARHPS